METRETESKTAEEHVPGARGTRTGLEGQTTVGFWLSTMVIGIEQVDPLASKTAVYDPTFLTLPEAGPEVRVGVRGSPSHEVAVGVA